MDFFEQIMNPSWKTFSPEYKEVLAGNILRYFVNPLLEVKNLRLASFQQGGMKTETFSVEIDGAPFVFIPGQKDVILGWDNGTTGLNALEIADDRREIYFSLEKCLSHWLQEMDFLDVDVFTSLHVEQDSDFDLNHRVNSQTSDLRSVTIPPLLVEMQPSYLGMDKKGEYSVVSGVFEGDWEWFQMYQEPIKKALFSDSQENEEAFVEFPAYFYEPNHFFMVQNTDLDHYTLYAAKPQSYQDIRKEIEKNGMGLLSSDEWEYCCGGTSRRLFRWGNKIQRIMFEPGESVLEEPNMFGLTIANVGWGPELVEDGNRVKGGWMNTSSANIVEKILPFSSYYMNRKNKLRGKEDAELPPGYYCFRRAIRIEM